MLNGKHLVSVTLELKQDRGQHLFYLSAWDLRANLCCLPLLHRCGSKDAAGHIMSLSSEHALGDKDPAHSSLADHKGLIAPGAWQRCC